MLIDADIVAVSPASVWRVLGQARRMQKVAPPGSTKKGTGFVQPVAVHEHWHIDIAHTNIHGTFYYLCVVLDGASRFLIAWDLRESMTEREIEVLLERAKERFPDARPHVALLPPVEREDGAMESIDQEKMHSAGYAVVAGRRQAAG